MKNPNVLYYSLLLICVGYPGDKTNISHPLIFQWKVNCPIGNIIRDRFSHKGASSGGMSGSPIYNMETPTKARVFAVHVGGDQDEDENYAVRITRHISPGK